MNIVILSGHLTRQPELKLTPSGVKVCNFGLASNERWTDTETGEIRESVTFVEAHAWNRTAEGIFEYFKKGDPILIHGSLRFESWETDDGQNRSRLTVRVQRWEFMQKRNGTENAPVTTPPTRDPKASDSETETAQAPPAAESQASSDAQQPF